MTGDPVVHLVVPWAELSSDPRPVHVAKIVRQPDGRLDLNLWLRGVRPDGTPKPFRSHFVVPVRVGPPKSAPETPGVPYAVEAFGLTRIGIGVWVVAPSVWVPGTFHAYVVVYDVPVPAPFLTAETTASVDTSSDNG